MSVQLKKSLDAIAVSPAQELFVAAVADRGPISTIYPYAVAPDGKRFLLRAAQKSALPLEVIVNWTGLLKKSGAEK